MDSSMASVLAEISRSDLDTPPTGSAAITGLQHVASYNWLEKSLPTISVPGAPPLWSPPPLPPTMMPDSGMVYIDQNAARSPRYPLEPLFRALHAQHPEFELGDIDLVTDRNNILKLLGFVQGSSSDDFEIQVEIAGSKTAVFTRVEIKTKDTVQGFRGFGHNFEKAYTKGLAGSTGHHRIVQYHFGGMKCLIRHVTDGYVDKKAGSSGIAKAGDVVDSMSDLLGAVSISTTSKNVSNMPVTVMKSETSPVDLASTLEIKTRSASRRLDMAEIAPQLWISQTPILVVGYHKNRIFHDIQLRNVEQDIRDWEIANQTALQKLAFLIKKICTAVERSDNRNGVVKYDGGPKLRVTSGEQKRALPDDLYSLWNVTKQREDDMMHDRSKDAGAPHTKSPESVPAPGQSKEDTNEVAASQQPLDAISPPSPTHDNTPFSDVIDCGVHAGFRQIFRRMPTRLSDYHSLCETLRSRAIDVLAGRKLRDIMKDMRRGKDDWDPDEGGRIGGLKSLARDSAFRLLYIFVVGAPESEVSDQNAAYNATTFVVSHRGIFKYKTRRMVREAFEERFPVSYNQRKGLDKWPIDDPSYRNSKEEEEDDDITTEEEIVDFDSDWSF